MSLTLDEWAFSLLKHGKECEDFIFSHRILFGADEYLQLAMELAQTHLPPDEPVEVMSIVSMIFIIGTYESMRSGRAKNANLHSVYETRESLVDDSLVEYAAISHMLRSMPEFPYDSIYEHYDGQSYGCITQLIGHKPMSLLSCIEQDDVDKFKWIYEINRKSFGDSKSLEYLVRQFASKPISCGAACRSAFLSDDSVRIAEMAERIFRPINGIRRNFRQFPSAIKFNDTGDISWLGRERLTRWLDAAKNVRPSVPSDNQALLEQAKLEYEKAVSNLIHYGADFFTPMIDHGLFETRYMMSSNMTDQQRYEYILTEISNADSGFEGIYLRAVIKALSPKLLIACANDDQLTACHRITGDRAYVVAIKDPLLKRKCLDRDMGLGM